MNVDFMFVSRDKLISLSLSLSLNLFDLSYTFNLFSCSSFDLFYSISFFSTISHLSILAMYDHSHWNRKNKMNKIHTK